MALKELVKLGCRAGLVSRWALAAVVLASVTAGACQQLGEAQVARRIVNDHRTRAKVKPLPGAGVIRVRLARRDDPEAAGTQVLEWDAEHFRDTVSSAGLTWVRGVQGGKSFYTDHDGVTRVGSEPLLAELTTLSYFWRRGYLFEDWERARPTLGPSDAASVTVGLTPRGGNTLWLSFARSDGRLLRAHAPRLDLAFESPTRFADTSSRASPVSAEIVHTGLPSGTIPDASVGGWSSRWEAPMAESALVRAGRGVRITGRLSGHAVAIAFDGAEDGPLRVAPKLADQLGLAFTRDVFGRRIARGVELSVGPLSFPSLWIQRADALPEGADVAAGASFFRETVVEVDPASQRVRFHDPARWVGSEGLNRILLDDDCDRPVVIVRRGAASLRLVAPTATASAIALTPEAAERLRVSSTGGSASLTGMFLGPALPALTVPIEPGIESDFGEDGRLGWDLLLQAKTEWDLPHRWLYLRPLSGQWR